MASFLAPQLFVLSLILVPVFVCLLFGLLIQGVFALPPFSFLRYLWAAYFGVMIVACLIALTLVQTAPVIEGFGIGGWKWAVYVAVLLVLSLIAAVSSFVYIAGWNAALHFSVFFALLIAGYGGLLTTLPEKTVSALGLGNYQAEALLFDPDYCDATALTRLPLAEGCALENVHVVWSLGETLVVRIGDGRIVQIPSRFSRAIVRSDK